MARSKHWLLGALRSRNNAILLKDSATNLLKTKNKHIGFFLLLTANEELEKAIWCILVYYEYVNVSQIETIFKQHEHKTFLFPLIYEQLRFVKNKIYFHNTPLTKFNLTKYALIEKRSVEIYKKLRESLLYVSPLSSGWGSPIEISKTKSFNKMVQIHKNVFMGLLQFFNIIGDYDLSKSGIASFKFFPKRNQKVDKGYSFVMSTVAKVKDRKRKLSSIPYTQNNL